MEHISRNQLRTKARKAFDLVCLGKKTREEVVDKLRDQNGNAAVFEYALVEKERISQGEKS